ncbi:MAG TPA: terminase family protein [Thermoleophilia bacterium]|nr:terminase family protein [Thermoleophilia bacterium]
MDRVTLQLDRRHWSAPQWKWIQSRERFSLLNGGFGSGKSTAGQAKVIKLKADNRGLPGLVIAQTYGALFENIVMPLIAMCEAALPISLVPRLVGAHGSRPHLLFADNCVVHLRSAEKPKSYDGLTVAWLYGDEVRHWSEEAYRVAIARVRIRAAALAQRAFTSTPEMHWMADEFNTQKAGRELIVCPTTSNAHNLVEGYIADLRASYSERRQRALLDGLFTVLEGAVYEELSSDIWNSQHAIDYTYDENRTTYLAVDPGRRGAWIFVQQLGKLEWVVFDELMTESVSDAEVVQIINRKGYKIDQIWTDPAADATQGAFNLDTIAMIGGVKTRSAGAIRYITAPWTSIRFGVDKVAVLLGNERVGQPIRLRFAKALRKLEEGRPRGVVRDMLAYQYPAHKTGHPMPAEPLKDGVHDHACLRWDTEVFVAGKWQRIDAIPASGMIATPAGERPFTDARMTRVAQVYEITMGNGASVVATGDHRFACRIDALGYPHLYLHDGTSTDRQEDPNVQWRTVLALRQLLQQATVPRESVSTSGGVGASSWDHSSWASCASQERGAVEQQSREPGSNRGLGAPEGAHDDGRAESHVAQGHNESDRRRSGMAQIESRESMASRTCAVHMGEEDASIRELRDVWDAIPNEGQKEDHQVLSSQLQDDRLPQASQILSIVQCGESPVYCLSVPTVRCFLLRGGIVSHNCDAIRYWAVGMWLTTGLQQLDRQIRDSIAKTGSPGYKVAG